MTAPETDLDTRYSEPEATATSWAEATALLAAAELSWLTTVRPDGRPHVTPLTTVMRAGTVHFSTGPEERKARNLAANPAVVLTTGSNALHGGTDLVVEGLAERVTGSEALGALAEAWVAKYGEKWRFAAGPEAFKHPAGGEAWVYAVRATTAFGFGKAPYSQTRWQFTADAARRS
jgi:PPOX class probable F420-dependent enzyme